jgi:hypothetical protein
MGQFLSTHTSTSSTKADRKDRASARHKPFGRKARFDKDPEKRKRVIFEEERKSRDVPKLPRSGGNRSSKAEELTIRLKPTSSKQKNRLVQTEANTKEKKECVVCTEMRSLHRFPERPPTTACKHNIDVCRKCLRTWLASEFSTKMWNELKCPICPAPMQDRDMWEFAPKDIAKRYVHQPKSEFLVNLLSRQLRRPSKPSRPRGQT